MKFRISSIIPVLFVVIASAITSCTYKKIEFVEPKDTTTVAVDSCKLNIKYSTHVKPIIDMSCANYGCHVPGGTGNGDFTTYAGLKAKVDNGSFKHMVLDTKQMPPSYSPGPTSLSTCELKKLEAWVADGAKND